MLTCLAALIVAASVLADATPAPIVDLERARELAADHDLEEWVSKDGRVYLFTSAKNLKSDGKLVEKTLDAFDDVLGVEQVHTDAALVIFGYPTGKRATFEHPLFLGASTDDDSERDADEEEDEREAGGLSDPGAAYFRSLTLDTHAAVRFGYIDAGLFSSYRTTKGSEWKEMFNPPQNIPEAQLVNRLTHLLLYRNYGPLPIWVRRGVAWHFEHELLGEVAAFPQRDNVRERPANEPENWNEILERNGTSPKRFEQIVKWTAAYYDDHSAQAWGYASHLLRNKKTAKALPSFLLSLSTRAEALSAENDGSLEVPADEQTALMEEHFGKKIQRDIERAFDKAEKSFK